MKLRKIEFGSALGGSGVEGFFGNKEYLFHKLPGGLSPDFTGMTFVSKTTTLLGRNGNARLKSDYTLRDLFPDCVKIKPFSKVMLNAFGLSGPGLGALLGTGKWQKRTKPFLISLMSLSNSPKRRKEELRIAVEMIGLCKEDFSAPFGLQINLSCPNTEHDPRQLIGESAEMLETANILGVPVMPKYSIASAPVEAIMQLNDNPNCDAICVSNTIPYDWEGIDWVSIFGKNGSPLHRYGGGGLSGKPLRPLVCMWIKRLRDAGFTKPINGGGGILCPEDVNHYFRAGASSIFLGSIAALSTVTFRPWRVAETISQANHLKWE